MVKFNFPMRAELIEVVCDADERACRGRMMATAITIEDCQAVYEYVGDDMVVEEKKIA